MDISDSGNILFKLLVIAVIVRKESAQYHPCKGHIILTSKDDSSYFDTWNFYTKFKI